MVVSPGWNNAPTPTPSNLGVEKMRRTMAQIKSSFQAGNGISNAVKVFLIKAKKGGALSMQLQLHETYVGDYYVATEKGKIKTFKDLDDAITEFSKWGLFGLLNQFATQNPELLEADPYTGDPIVKAGKDLIKVTAKRDEATADAAKLTTAISLMPSVTTKEMALVAEVTEQRDAVLGSAAYYEAERVRIAALLAA